MRRHSPTFEDGVVRLNPSADFFDPFQEIEHGEEGRLIYRFRDLKSEYTAE